MILRTIDDLCENYPCAAIFRFAEHLAKEGKFLHRIKMIPLKCDDHYELLYLAQMEDGSEDGLGIKYALDEGDFEGYLEREKQFAKKYLIPTTVFPLLRRLDG